MLRNESHKVPALASDQTSKFSHSPDINTKHAKQEITTSQSRTRLHLSSLPLTLASTLKGSAPYTEVPLLCRCARARTSDLGLIPGKKKAGISGIGISLDTSHGALSSFGSMGCTKSDAASVDISVSNRGWGNVFVTGPSEFASMSSFVRQEPAPKA